MLSRLAYVAVSLMTGFAVGWLVILSASSVAGTIVSAAISTVSLAYAGIAVFRRTSFREISQGSSMTLAEAYGAMTVCAVAVGLALGVTAALRAKAADWFEPKPADVMKHWPNVGLNEAELTKRLFEKAHPPSAPK